MGGAFCHRESFSYKRTTMLFVILAICFIGGSFGMTTHTHRPHHSTHQHVSHTHRPHATHDPHTNENFFFHVEGTVLAVKHGKECFIYNLDAQQQMDIKTSHGLHEIEKNVIDIVDAGAVGTMLGTDDLQAISPKLPHYCGHNQAFSIN